MTKPEQTLPDAPIEERYRDVMAKVARLIESIFNEGAKGRTGKTGFVLLTFDFGDKGCCNTISNANRRDVVVLLREQLARFEGAPDVTGPA